MKIRQRKNNNKYDIDDEQAEFILTHSPGISFLKTQLVPPVGPVVVNGLKGDND
jgi:hypothetical protein